MRRGGQRTAFRSGFPPSTIWSWRSYVVNHGISSFTYPFSEKSCGICLFVFCVVFLFFSPLSHIISPPLSLLSPSSHTPATNYGSISLQKRAALPEITSYKKTRHLPGIKEDVAGKGSQKQAEEPATIHDETASVRAKDSWGIAVHGRWIPVQRDCSSLGS